MSHRRPTLQRSCTLSPWVGQRSSQYMAPWLAPPFRTFVPSPPTGRDHMWRHGAVRFHFGLPRWDRCAASKEYSTKLPSENPTKIPTENLMVMPMQNPTENPMLSPTEDPSKSPSSSPTVWSMPSAAPIPYITNLNMEGIKCGASTMYGWFS
jgi:hypothetical protein